MGAHGGLVPGSGAGGTGVGARVGLEVGEDLVGVVEGLATEEVTVAGDVDVLVLAGLGTAGLAAEVKIEKTV